MVVGYSTSHFLGDYWKNVPLYAEKIVPLLDYCLSNNYVFSDQMSQAFYELIDKYQNTAELPIENIKEFIREHGYGYIVDLFGGQDENLKLLIYLLELVHELKGTEMGLRVVISLFQLDTEPADIEIIQWFEETPVAEENTFAITVAKLDALKIGNNFFENFSKFVRNYVYPELRSLLVKYTIFAKKQQVPVTNITMNITAKGELP